MKRSRHEITRDILKVCRKGARKTHIVYRANLNFSIINDYLKNLLDGELLIPEGPFYRTTPEGVQYMELFEDLSNLL